MNNFDNNPNFQNSPGDKVSQNTQQSHNHSPSFSTVVNSNVRYSITTEQIKTEEKKEAGGDDFWNDCEEIENETHNQ